MPMMRRTMRGKWFLAGRRSFGTWTMRGACSLLVNEMGEIESDSQVVRWRRMMRVCVDF